MRRYLEGSGVPGDRLEAKGMGERRPLQRGGGEAVQATIRRVEFWILDGPPPPEGSLLR